jgi:hypothetical protein
MTAKRALEVLAKLEKSYKVKLGLSKRFAAKPEATTFGYLFAQRSKYRKQVEDYSEILEALELATSKLEE